jgi:hypothetical protein
LDSIISFTSFLSALGELRARTMRLHGQYE